MFRFNHHMSQLDGLGLIFADLFLGPIVLSRGYGIYGPGDSGQVVQAALCTERGAVVIYWDTNEYEEYRASDTYEAEAYVRAQPLPDSPVAIQVLAWPAMGPLVDQFLRSLPVS